MQATRVPSLGWEGGEDALEEVMATHSSILSRRIPMDRGAWRVRAHQGRRVWLTEQLSRQAGCIIHLRQKVETTQCPLTKERIKTMGSNTYNSILLSLKKERKFWPGYNTDEPWECYTGWNKPVTKWQIVKFQLHLAFRVILHIETESRLVVSKGWEDGKIGTFPI